MGSSMRDSPHALSTSPERKGHDVNSEHLHLEDERSLHLSTDTIGYFYAISFISCLEILCYVDLGIN